MTEKTVAKNWSDEAVATLNSIVGATNPVSVALVEQAASALGKTTRSIASKLRQLDREVVSMAKEKVAAFTVEEGEALRRFVSDNAGQFTYKQISENFRNGQFTAKQVQGKLLALELTSSVRPAEKVEAASKYSEAEEAQFVQLANSGAFIEDIASALSKELSSVRGKALSLIRKGMLEKIPAQRESHSNAQPDPIDTLGARVASMTVAEIAAAADKTPRGIKTMLTRRGVDCADYKGSAKREKAEAKTVV